MPKKKAKVTTTGNTCKPGCKGMLILGGIISILLGLSLWFTWLDLTQTFAIVFVLAGLAKLIMSGKC